MKETNTTYSLRYVAFLDLLGFKTLVDQSDSNQEILDKINLALEYTAGHEYALPLSSHNTFYTKPY